eukprot:CAMPEP_0119153678 /NCGR_PEP_ID=MMETSP1310-20130426/49610_1 /TAXON_ID=464262 /ORGANISM="Genus nov. species nov., Strain RCC2339" /LENGTH=33 /DNA_ID= /DNA_START= /DNA_END= /DNA_ORIENTATION=
MAAADDAFLRAVSGVLLRPNLSTSESLGALEVL